MGGAGFLPQFGPTNNDLTRQLLTRLRKALRIYANFVQLVTCVKIKTYNEIIKGFIMMTMAMQCTIKISMQWVSKY